MKKSEFGIFFAILLSISFVFNSFGQGGTLSKSFLSNSLQSERNFDIYLPPTYDKKNPELKFPVIYFLHGSTVDHTAYSQYATIFNILILGQKIQPVIIVMPDASVEPYAGSFYSNSELYGDFEDYMIQDLIPHIDSTYNTLALREQRAITGHSMGGFGAIKLAVKYPDLFIATASLSGPLNITFWDDVKPVMLETLDGPPYEFTPDTNNIYLLETFSMAGAFSPNLNNPPYYVDLPIDENGNLKQDILNTWEPDNPAFIVSQSQSLNNLQIYFDVGNKDHFQLEGQNSSFSDTLTKYNIQHTFEVFDGGHTDQIISRAPIALAFISDAFKQNTTNIHTTKGEQQVHAFPNPCSQYVSMRLSGTATSCMVTLFDQYGRFMVRVNDIEVSQSIFTLETSNLHTGMYYANVIDNNGQTHVLQFVKK